MELPRSMTGPYHVLQFCLFLLLITACASPDSPQTSATATLLWDASEGPGLVGYQIYQATAPGGYGAPIATVNMSVTSYSVTNLESGTTYFFTVTAYNSDDAESSFSNEVSKSIL
jgi:hypothetical protein